MKKLAEKITYLAFFSDLHGTRFALMLSEIIWAIALWLPGDTFGRPTYHLMEQMIHDEDIWGVIWFVSAMLQGYILYTSEYHSRFATWFALFNSALWWIVVVSMYLSVSPPPAAISAEAAMAVAAAWVWIRSGWIVDTKGGNYCGEHR